MIQVDIRVRETEATDPQPQMLWDTQFNLATQTWDWMLAGYSDSTNRGGLLAQQPLNTAILIQLGTHRRAESYDAIPNGSDPKGWWGDTIDLQANETRIGSRLWLLYRSPLNADTARRAESYATEALQPLIDQGAVVTFTTTARVDKATSALVLDIAGYSQDGQKIYNQQFARVWTAQFAVLNPSPVLSGAMPL